MVGLHDSSFKNPALKWIDTRLPILTLMDKEYGKFPTPRNFNYLWNFGALSMFMLATMIVTGIVLAMQYTPDADLAFGSIERIMRDVNHGWMLRYMHMNGAHMFFLVVFIHMFRSLYYGSYKQPRELLWIFGVIILLLMMATAFMGYVLPWSQMSGWGATVITNLFSAVPFFGEEIVTFLWGGFSVDNPTLNRFFALHFTLPFVIAGVVFLHVWALHVTGSNNPTGIDPKGPQDTVPFHPYYTTKDIFGLVVFLIVFAVFIFYAPRYLGHADHFVEYDSLVTPEQIVPEWYFLPFYAMLRAITFDILFIDAKLGGVIAMFGSIILLFFLPWLDRSPVRSANYRPLYRIFFWLLVANVIMLGYVGAMPAEGIWVPLSQIGTAWYFIHFLLIIPFLHKFEKTEQVPESISKPVLSGSAGPMPAGAPAAPADEGK